MGRPKIHVDAAAKHRAYRARLAAETVRVDRSRWAALEGQANRLAEAVARARAVGCPVACEIRGVVAAGTVLDSLSEWFEAWTTSGTGSSALAKGTAPSREERGAAARPARKEASATEQ